MTHIYRGSFFHVAGGDVYCASVRGSVYSRGSVWIFVAHITTETPRRVSRLTGHPGPRGRGLTLSPSYHLTFEFKS